MIEKLIKQYQQKKSERELIINELSTVVRHYRRNDELPGFYNSIDEVLLLRKKENALHQAYDQFIIELKEIGDID